MAAPPPPRPPPPTITVDEYDDGFDWEAAVREIDTACALASSSASVSVVNAAASPSEPPSKPLATAPPPRPSAGSRQSTLDRFVDSFTKRKRAKERAASAAASTSGRGRPGDRAGKGCSREAEVLLEPCAVALDPDAAQTWIYPTNVEVREYQRLSVQKALFTNTLVALPTGLGKTFIAAVVMYNYFRWFPEGKIVFSAPSRPLVTQQIEACHNIVGIPQKWTIDMTGNLHPSKRPSFWESKRVFFVTPQILEKDIQSGKCMVKQIVCLVIDEAHRATGNHSYCVAVRELMAVRVPLRILALTATPGSKHEEIQSVIDNLCISELAHHDEDDLDVSKYVHNRTIELIKVPVGSDAAKVSDMLLVIIRPHLARLTAIGVIPYRGVATWRSHELLDFRGKFRQAPPPNIPHAKKGEIEGSFAALITLYHIVKLLLVHGIKPAYEFFQDKLKERPLQMLMAKNESFWQAKKMMENSLSTGVPSPKMQKLMEVLVDHFNKHDPKESRVIIFSHFRESVKEILCQVRNIGNGLVRAKDFIGQSSGKRLKGQTQKVQQAVLKEFRSGVFNVIVATSIGEEGLDIMEVDLVICFDANVSPLRMIQRMGRTGRKHDGRVVLLACEGQEVKGYYNKQGSTRTMKKLLRNASFEYHSSPRMIPHVYKPELKLVQLLIEKYIPHCKKKKVNTGGTSPILTKISDEDGQLIARYFGAGKEDTWKPSLVAFPGFQVSPCDVYKVPHSFRTTAMLIDAMQQLQDLSFSRTKNGSPFQELADVASVEDQAQQGLYAGSGVQEAIPHEECHGTEASCKEVAWSKSVSLPSSPVMKHPIHSCLFSGDYVAVDARGYVSITFVPVLSSTSALHEDTKNATNELHHKIWNNTSPCKLADVSRQTVEFDCPADVVDLVKPLFVDNVLSLSPHSLEYAEQCKHADDKHALETPPSKRWTSPREKCETPCNAKLASPAFSGWQDVELSPRLTHYIEEGIVPESPVLQVSRPPLEIDSAANVSSALKFGSSKSHVEGAQTNVVGSQQVSLSFEKTGEVLAGITELAGSPRRNVLDRTQEKIEAPPLNEKIGTTVAHTPTANQLCDSFSDDWQFKPGDASGSVQQAPKFKRLCKYGDKIKRVSSTSLEDKYKGFVGEQCEPASITLSNQMVHAMGNKRKAKKRLNTFIDEEAEVSEDADVTEDEDDDLNEDKYEDSFIDDQSIPTGQSSQAEHGGENTGDMMAFYRSSLFTQSPVVLPSRYCDASDNSASRTGTASCSSENMHNYTETPQGILRTHRSIDPSPLGYQQSCVGRASSINGKSKTSIIQCELSSELNCRKRKLSFQQAGPVPVVDLEPAPQPSSNLNGVNDDKYLDDAFYASLDLDAIEAQATELWRLQAAQSTQKPLEVKQVPDASFAPPSFDLGF